MRPDRLHVAVRPRGILECLDLAVMFCGRRPLGVAIATLAGALPCILLNRWLFGPAAGADDLFAAAWVLGMEAPWAAAPLTLYLGQAVFAERFSWRQAWSSFVGALPGFVLFQVLLRAVLLGIVILAPVAYVGMMFINPILLLERPRLRRVWSRRGAMNQLALGHTISLLAVSTVVLAVGWWVAVNFLESFASLWRGGGLVADESDDVLTRLLSWPGQLALWAVAALVTAFRFFAYLDARIRREGWDVELKLRAPATWAGIGTRTGVLAGSATIALVLAAAWAPPACAGPDPAGDDGGRARVALRAQRFPWYDAAADGYRPLVSAERRRPPPPADGPVPPDLPSVPLEGLGTGLMIAVGAALVAGAVWLLVRHGLPSVAAARAVAEPLATPLGAEQLDALPGAARGVEGDLLERAAASAGRGDYATAMVFFHSWQLVQFHARGVLELARGKTTRQYAAEVAANLPAAAGLFRRSSRLFEDAFFGRLAVARDDFAAVWEQRAACSATPPAGG